MLGNLLAGRFEDPDIDFLPQVNEIAAVSPVVLQKLHKSLLQRQHFAHKPRVHVRSGHYGHLAARLGAFTIKVWFLCHPPPALASRGSGPHEFRREGLRLLDVTGKIICRTPGLLRASPEWPRLKMKPNQCDRGP